jgi:uncharacterized membrane protein YphA (DoxX/SURF4 family)
MKTLIPFIFASFLLVSCVRESTATEDLMEMAPENAILKYSGNFMQGPYGNNVNGKAEIYEKDGIFTLVFNDAFTVSNGPELCIANSTTTCFLTLYWRKNNGTTMKNYINWALRLIPAIILLQTLFFKFTAHPDSVAIFSKLHAEPYGRIFSGVLELITAVLILNPKTTFWGAILGFFTMLGAIASHIFILGIETNNDGGKLFFLAVTVLVFCVILLFKFKKTKV